MKQQVLELIVNKPRHFAKIIKNTPEMLNWVQSNTKIVSDNFAEVVYSAIHDGLNTINHSGWEQTKKGRKALFC